MRLMKLCVHRWVVTLDEDPRATPIVECEKCESEPPSLSVVRDGPDVRITILGMRKVVRRGARRVLFDCIHPLRALTVSLGGTVCRRCGSFKPHPLVQRKQRAGTGTHNRVETQA